MMHIQDVGFIHCSVMAGKLQLSHLGKFIKQKDESERMTLISRGGIETDLYRDWKSAKSLLARFRSMAAGFAGTDTILIDAAYIERITVGSVIDWTQDDSEYAANHVRVMICLDPSPGCWLYAGGEGVVLGYGRINLVNTRALHSSVNFGPVAQIRLCLDLTKTSVDNPE